MRPEVGFRANFIYGFPKGPVIGPLIISGIVFEEKDLNRLKTMGVKDSKLLSLKKIELLSKKVKAIAKKYKIIAVFPREIDEAVESDHLNLNWLEAIKTAEIINELSPDKAYIDCPSPNIKAYTNYLKKYIKKEVDLVVEHNADKAFLPVSAASIISKNEREREVAKIEKLVGQSIGTGYISNSVCQKFLKENWDKYPEIFRKSWISWKNHKEAKQQKRLNEF